MKNIRESLLKNICFLIGPKKQVVMFHASAPLRAPHINTLTHILTYCNQMYGILQKLQPVLDCVRQYTVK